MSRFSSAIQRSAPKTWSWAPSRSAAFSLTAAATSCAMVTKGTASGTSRTGKPRSSAAARKACRSGGVRSWVLRTSAATPASSSRSR
ncbi:hypothetical protein ACWGKQ_12450 [Streptomyces sp. NPDC054770]